MKKEPDVVGVSAYPSPEAQIGMEGGENFIHVARKTLQRDIVPSFDSAWQDMKHGSPGRLALKVVGVGLGPVVVADGVYNLIQGFDAETDDLFIPSASGRNFTRMFVGACEVVSGAAALYLGLTKGGKAVRSLME